MKTKIWFENLSSYPTQPWVWGGGLVVFSSREVATRYNYTCDLFYVDFVGFFEFHKSKLARTKALPCCFSKSVMRPYVAEIRFVSQWVCLSSPVPLNITTLSVSSINNKRTTEEKLQWNNSNWSTIPMSCTHMMACRPSWLTKPTRWRSRKLHSRSRATSEIAV